MVPIVVLAAHGRHDGAMSSYDLHGSSLFPGVPQGLLSLLSECAGAYRLAIVGGAVRDLLLHREHHDLWRGLPDLDLVVEGDPGDAAATRFLQSLERSGRVMVLSSREHGAYGTVEIELQFPTANHDAQQTIVLDVASARRETYPLPAGKPQICFAGLDDDLARRDFTINAMALLLDGSSQLLDPHGGQIDLAQRQLRFLHHNSVRDDPSRVLRAARYAARLKFQLAKASLAELRHTLDHWPWFWIQGDPPEHAPPALRARLRMELELLLEHEPWLQALEALQSWGGMVLLDPGLQRDVHWRRRLRWAARLNLPLLPALVLGADDPLALAQRLQLPQRQLRLLQEFVGLRAMLGNTREELSFRNARDWTHWIEGLAISPDVVALALAASVGPRRPLLRWWFGWRHCRAAATAQELIAWGVPVGPEVGRHLRELRDERLLAERL